MEDRLKKFARLVDAGSFTKAADAMHISQPALSSAINKLERELKVRLLVRGARPLLLTQAGDLVYKTAKELEVQTESLKQRLAELSHQPLSLRIGMIDSVADVLFGFYGGLDLAAEAEVLVDVNNSRYLLEAVERGDLDIAFVAEQRRRLPLVLDSKFVAIEPLVVVSHKFHTIPTGEVLSDFIAYDQSSNTFQLVQEAFEDFGVKPEAVFYSTSPEVMLRLVLLGRGVAALPYLMVREHLAAGRLRRLGQPDPWFIPRRIVAIKRRDRELPSALKSLAGQVAESLDELTSEIANP